MKIFCLIPAYNETGNIKELSERLIKTFQKLKIPHKIFYVLQGDEKAAKLIKQLKKTYPQLDYAYFPNPLGIGYAYKFGFSRIDKSCSHVLTLDADLNHQPEELPKFIDAWNISKADIVIGSRFIPGGKFADKRIWKRIISNCVNLIIQKILGVNIADKTSGFRLIKRESAEIIRRFLHQKNYPFYMEFILLAVKNGYRIEEVPISYIPRKWGKSKMSKVNTFIDYIKFLPKVLFNF